MRYDRSYTVELLSWFSKRRYRSKIGDVQGNSKSKPKAASISSSRSYKESRVIFDRSYSVSRSSISVKLGASFCSSFAAMSKDTIVALRNFSLGTFECPTAAR